MAKFCTNCGKPLEDGKCPSCSNKSIKTNSNVFVDSLKKYFDLLKRSFKEPVDVLKENNTDDNFIVALISIALSSIFCGLFMCGYIKSLLGVFSNFVSIPYFKIFIYGFILIAVILSITALAGYLIFGKLFKGETTLKKMFVWVGLSSFMLTIALALIAILSFISLDASSINVIYISLGIASILWIAYMIKSFDSYVKGFKENLFGYACVLMYAITGISVYFYIKEILPSLMK